VPALGCCDKDAGGRASPWACDAMILVQVIGFTYREGIRLLNRHLSKPFLFSISTFSIHGQR
jgi:hypothetical protein